MGYITVLDEGGSLCHELTVELSEQGHLVSLVHDVALGMELVQLLRPDVLIIAAPRARTCVESRLAVLRQIAPVIDFTDSVADSDDGDEALRACPYCPISAATHPSVVIDLVNALLVPYPEEAIR